MRGNRRTRTEKRMQEDREMGKRIENKIVISKIEWSRIRRIGQRRQ